MHSGVGKTYQEVLYYYKNELTNFEDLKIK